MSGSKSFREHMLGGGRDSSAPLPQRPPVAWIFGEKVRSPASTPMSPLRNPTQSPQRGYTRNPLNRADPFDEAYDMSSEDEDVAMAPLAPPPSLYSQRGQPSPSVGSLKSIKDVYGRASMRGSSPAMAQLSSPLKQKPQLHLPRTPLQRQRSPMRSTSEATTNSRSTAADGTPGDFSPGRVCAPTSETRIVAPNVDKLSPGSVVEICLASEAEHVKVLCSVDVLKMQSTFFREVLFELDIHDDHPVSLSGWRDPVVLPDHDPYEAAAFLESLHEGRHMYSQEWSFAWTRLAVSWVIDDLEREYAMQIHVFMTNIMDTINNNHWRCNPNVLAGMPVAVFRKTASKSPLILMGTVLEATQAMTAGRVRVAFDGLNVPPGGDSPIEHVRGGGGGGGGGGDNASLHSPSPLSVYTPLGSGGGGGQTPYTPMSHRGYDKTQVGDVTEPFWVKGNSEAWAEPDDVFVSQGFITAEDRKTFWEMTQALVEMPTLVKHLSSEEGDALNVDSIVEMLRRPECRELWTTEGHTCLPKSCACILLQAAYADNLKDSTATAAGL